MYPFLHFAAVFLLKHYGTDAVPLPSPTTTPSVFEVPVFARDDFSGGCNTRAILNILWSCLATTFACTWVSVHPNVPWRNEGTWAILGRRIFLMFFSILVPELMIMWAFKQWRGALKIKKAVNRWYRDLLDKPWTITHGHFLQMGGFRLQITMRENIFKKESTVFQMRDRELIPEHFSSSESDVSELVRSIMWNQLEKATGSQRPREISEAQMKSGDHIFEGVLTFDSLIRLLDEDLIIFPNITEGVINDRSKGDALSKGIAFFQLTWFIIQIIARYAQGLAISELELTTAALAGLNSAMYVFWWSKPCDVRFPVMVRSKRVEELLAKRPENTSSQLRILKTGINLGTHVWAKGVNRDRYRQRNVGPDDLNEGLELIGMDVSIDAQTVSTVPSDGDDARTKQNARTFYNGVKWTMKLVALPFHILIYVIDLVLYIPIAMILNFETEGRSLSEFTGSCFATIAECKMFLAIFYSEEAGARLLLGTSSLAGALFGAVHCLAWHFSFPSRVEQIMWRAASLGVVGSCAATLNGVVFIDLLDEPPGFYNYIIVAIGGLLGILSIFVYPVARMTLLILAVTSLRSLPSSAFDTVDWVDLVPHI